MSPRSSKNTNGKVPRKLRRTHGEAEAATAVDTHAIGVVPSELIVSALTPPFTKPGVRMPVRAGTTMYHSPIRTVIRQSIISMPAKEAEESDKYKQIVPFVVLFGNNNKMMVVRKIDPNRDIHPTHEYSIGLLGHLHGGEGIYEGLYRITEEQSGVRSKDISTCVFSGYIYNNPNHVGLIFATKIEECSIKMPKGSYTWEDYNAVQKLIDNGKLDTWSTITYEHVVTPRHTSGAW